MSLVSQLHNGRIGQWADEYLTGVGRLVDAVQTVTRDCPPVRPPGRPGLEYWGAVGSMFGLRLACLVEQAPPYAAILGGLRGGLLTSDDASKATGAWPSHRTVPAGLDPLGQRPTPAGWWNVVGDELPQGDDQAEGGLPMFLEAAASISRFPAGSLGEDSAELELLDHLADLTSLENFYRSGRDPEVHLDAGMLTADWQGLLHRTRTGRALPVARQLLADPAAASWGHASPTIVHRWAEADVLLGPGPDGGYTLLDVKTVVNLSDQQRIARWIAQTLAYAWLDVTDRWRIRRIGLWLARHGVIMSWDVRQAAEIIVGRGSKWGLTSPVTRARKALLVQAHAAMTEDGGRPPAEWKA